MQRTCSVEGCDQRFYAREWCILHYERWRRHGNPLALKTRSSCIVAGCTRLHHARTYCILHYRRWKQHGDPMIVLSGGRPVDDPPTPHSELTYAGWNRTAFPTPPYETMNNAAADRYAAANQRDGYLSDPEYIAAVAAWRAGDLPDALPLAAD
jgi:hypothetical protein